MNISVIKNCGMETKKNKTRTENAKRSAIWCVLTKIEIRSDRIVVGRKWHGIPLTKAKNSSKKEERHVQSVFSCMALHS